MDVVVGYSLDVDALYAAADGFQQSVGLFRHHDEYGLRGRFLQQFQYLVGALCVHAFRQPHQAYLVSALARLQRQLAHQFVALASRDNGLLVLAAHLLQPFCHGEVRSAHDQFMPFLGKIVADGLMVASH